MGKLVGIVKELILDWYWYSLITVLEFSLDVRMNYFFVLVKQLRQSHQRIIYHVYTVGPIESKTHYSVPVVSF